MVNILLVTSVSDLTAGVGSNYILLWYKMLNECIMTGRRVGVIPVVVSKAARGEL